MAIFLLHRLSRVKLPFTVSGLEVPAIEALVLGGLIIATTYVDPLLVEASRATVHRITPMGIRHINAFPAGAPDSREAYFELLASS